jgi:hypothetical protein
MSNLQIQYFPLIELKHMHNVTRLLETINSNKATGLDGIPGRILMLSADVVSPSLTKIFNHATPYSGNLSR